MLTAGRSAEVRLATWDEIDVAGRVGTISAVRMKAKREHRVPVCGRALEILDAARALGDGNPLMLPMRSGNALSPSTLPKMLQYHRISAVAHGFRSSFRDWAAEETDHPREVIEEALAHVVQNKVEAAYARSDLFERRAAADGRLGRLPRWRGPVMRPSPSGWGRRPARSHGRVRDRTRRGGSEHASGDDDRRDGASPPAGPDIVGYTVGCCIRESL